MMIKSLDMKIRDWYRGAFPSDPLWPYLNKESTFGDLRSALNDHHNVYPILGVGDSVVREMCFVALARFLRVDYMNIYYLWLRGEGAI